MKTAILSLVITLALAVAGAYYLEQYQHFALQTQQSQSKLQSQIDNEIKPSITRLETKLQDVKQDEHWKISEVIYLLRLSIEQLKMTQDVQTSLRLLQAADDQLKTIQDPTLSPVREMINQERHALETVKFPDIQGLWLSIGAMISKVNNLPTRGIKIDSSTINSSTTAQESSTVSSPSSVPSPTPTSSATPTSSQTTVAKQSDWKDNLKKTMTKLNDIVKIQRHTKPIEPILPDYEQALAKENVRLLLEQLRWALLNKQTKIFQNLIKEINQYLDSYFDSTDENVKNMHQSLQTMSTIDLQPALPEVGKALQLLQKR